MRNHAQAASYDVRVELTFTVNFKTDADTAEEARQLGLAIMRDAELRSETLNPEDDECGHTLEHRCFSWNVERPKERVGWNGVTVYRSDEWRAANEPEAHVYQLAQMASRLRTLETEQAIIPERARPILDRLIAAQRRDIDNLVAKILPMTAPLPLDGEVAQ